jgi:hypothetical protein
MPAIPTPDNKAQKKLFHNEWINVYPTTLPLEKIHFWKENNRTIFTFERLCRLKEKELDKLTIEEITRFVAEQDTHKLQILADSVGRNGVQVPLIIRDDGKLLDGNRRYFACEWLKMQHVDCGMKPPDFLSRIPVLVIRKADLKDTLELKILAEANFIPDLKIPWPLDAQARAVEEYYWRFRKAKNADHETALTEVVSVFGIKRQRAVDLMDSLNLTKKFIAGGAKEDEQIRRRAIVEEKYVYFWEFLNKAMKGRGAYTITAELEEVRGIFFDMMAKGIDNPITNVKQVEPLAQARRDPTAWNILKESKGAKLALVVSIMNEKKEGRKAEDKIRVFLGWLKDAEGLAPNAKALLREVAKLAEKKSRD